jgi:hypothetical protein
MIPVSFFPRLTVQNHRVTSPPSTSYNCIAWAAGVSSNWWWPVFDPVQETCTWPANAPRELTLPAFVAAFLGLALNYAEYESEIYRGALEAVPVGQLEAARTLMWMDLMMWNAATPPHPWPVPPGPSFSEYSKPARPTNPRSDAVAAARLLLSLP